MILLPLPWLKILGPASDLCAIYRDDHGQARIFAKEPAIAAGVETAAEVFRRVDPKLEVKVVRPSGSRLESGETVIQISGGVRSILSAERVALNFMQRLSGIATLTRRFVDAIAGARARILDTRKTTPGMRGARKGGGGLGAERTHRFGLLRHGAGEGTIIRGAVGLRGCRLRSSGFATNPARPIGYRSGHPRAVREFLTLEGIDVILLDNMSCADLAAAVHSMVDAVSLKRVAG